MWAVNGLGLALVLPNTQVCKIRIVCVCARAANAGIWRGHSRAMPCQLCPAGTTLCPSTSITIQSLTADLFAVAARGRAFGMLYLTSALGGMLGALFATNLGEA